MASVFISYSSEDASEARRLARELTRRGIRTWIDEYEILPGDSIREKIYDGLRQSEFLVVIISRSSVKSQWVQWEIQHAIANNAGPRIIPVLIDDTTIPEYISHLRYVDLRTEYSRGINDLVTALSNRDLGSAPAVSEVFRPENLVEQTQRHQKESKGAGHVITTVLGIVTLLVTALAAVPSFYSAFGNKAKIYYSSSEQRLVVPSGVDEAQLHKICSDNNIPEAILTVAIINNGDAAAKEIKLGIHVPGRIKFTKSDPAPDPEPVWVKVGIKQDLSMSPAYTACSFSDLVPARIVTALVGYEPTDSTHKPIIDVVYDGRQADKIDNIERAPKWSYWELVRIPLIVLVIGLFVTACVGITVFIRANPRAEEKVREAALLIVKGVNPMLANILDVMIRWRS